MICPEQENIVWMKNIVQTFMKQSDLVLDVCTEKFSVAKAFILFPKPRWFTGCELDPSSVTEAMLYLIILYP